MGWADILIVAVIGVSTLISLVRGFVREALSLAAWVLAFLVALTFADQLAAYAGFLSDSEPVRVIAAFTTLFVLTLIAAAIVNYLVFQLVTRTGLGGTDRLVGMLFGLARGGVVVAVLVMVGMLAGMQDETWWTRSPLVGAFEPLAGWLYGFVPDTVMRR